jgi:hypothetical protein
MRRLSYDARTRARRLTVQPSAPTFAPGLLFAGVDPAQCQVLCSIMLPAPLNVNEADLGVLYRALGRGLVQWQPIETALYLAAFGAMGVSHAECSREFFKKPGAGSRLKFTDGVLSKALRPDAYEKTWVPLRDDTNTFVKYRNCLAHFEVYHITDHGEAATTLPTKYNVTIAESHMNFSKRSHDRVDSLSIELIDQNNSALREIAYLLYYFVVDHFPLDAFMGKGLLPLIELQLTGFYGNPRLSEFPRPDYAAR